MRLGSNTALQLPARTRPFGCVSPAEKQLLQVWAVVCGPAAAEVLCVSFSLSKQVRPVPVSSNNQELILQRAQVICFCARLLRMSVAGGETGLVRVGLLLDRWHWRMYWKEQLSSQRATRLLWGLPRPSAHGWLYAEGKAGSERDRLASGFPWAVVSTSYCCWWVDVDWISHRPSCWGGLRHSWPLVLPTGKRCHLGWLLTRVVIIRWEAKLVSV